jgi:hypothetical protein
MKNNKVFVDELLKRQRDLLDRILRNEKQPPIETLIPTWNKIKEKKTQLSLELIYGLISEINDINFNFLEIYQYYFNNDDPYYDDMIVLLNLTEQGASLVNMFNENHPIHGIRFKRIMSEAREKKMVERVRAYMNQQNRLTKIVIFTGKKHVENLYNELLKDKKYTVKKRNIDE